MIRLARILPIFGLLTALTLLSGAHPAIAQQETDLRPLIDALGDGRFAATSDAIGKLAATGDSRVARPLEALESGDLYKLKETGGVFIGDRDGRTYTLTDPITGEAAGEAGWRDVDKIKVNNALRRQIRAALGSITLMNPNPATRRAAVAALFRSGDPDAIEALDGAIEKESDEDIRALMREARAVAVLNSDAASDAKLEAISILEDRGDQQALARLAQVARESEGEVSEAAAAAVTSIESRLALWDAAQNVTYGLSLGSVLLLAAIGLAITFGVMGVINMAHGEMVMLGAYTTFVVQEVIRNHAPWLFEWSLTIAVPLAFLVAGAVGIAIERGVIRFLYGRPLETLLATWGISLVLQQAVRSIFGPSNREVGNPEWMSGALDVAGLTLTYNRAWIIVFSLVVFGALILVMRRTAFGLHMRAVTQNRPMASAMGIRTDRVDALTFGLGSGVAGIAGVALSQIDNVSPNLGQSYIVDSFMVVVFGGVGNLWGTLVGATTLGIANKFLEPYAGAVLAKILVLVFIILFIQKRPRGLFALKGRSVEG